MFLISLFLLTSGIHRFIDLKTWRRLSWVSFLNQCGTWSFLRSATSFFSYWSVCSWMLGSSEGHLHNVISLLINLMWWQVRHILKTYRNVPLKLSFLVNEQLFCWQSSHLISKYFKYHSLTNMYWLHAYTVFVSDMWHFYLVSITAQSSSCWLGNWDTGKKHLSRDAWKVVDCRNTQGQHCHMFMNLLHKAKPSLWLFLLYFT